MNLTWFRHPKFKWGAAFFIICFFFNGAIFFFGILGSGIFPIAGWLFIVIAAAISLVLALIVLLLGRWLVPGVVLLLLLNVFITLSVFLFIIQAGFKQAKIYAEKLVPEIEAIHNSQGRWPANLSELPPNRRPLLSKSALWPLLAYERDGRYIDIGGSGIHYSVIDNSPSLSVGRRDLYAFWNWSKGGWEASPTPRPE